MTEGARACAAYALFVRCWLQRKCALSAFAAAWCALLLGAQHTPPPSAKSGADRPLNVDHYARGIDGQLMNLMRFTDTPRRDGVARWMQALGIPKSCEQCMDERFNNLVLQHNAVLDAQAPEYVRQSADLGALAQSFDSSRSSMLSGAAAAVNSRAEKLRASLEKVELDFIDDVAQCITAFGGEDCAARTPADVSALLEPMRQAAARRYAREWRIGSQWSNLDLRWVVEALPPDLLNTQLRDTTRAALAEYDLQLTPLVKQYGASYLRLVAKIAEASAKLNADLIDRPAFVADTKAARGRSVNAARAIRLLNERTAQVLTELMPPAASRSFAKLVKQRAFPDLYPDPTSLDGFFDRVLSDVDVRAPEHPDIADTVLQLRSGYEAECASVNQRLEALAVESAERAARNDPSRREEDRQEYLALVVSRSKISKRWADAVLAAMPEASVERTRHALPDLQAEREQ